MSNALVQYQASDGQNVKLSPEIVAKYIVTGNSEAEPKDVMKFIAQCQARGLNPLAGDAYMTTYRNRDGGTTSSVITSKDYFVRTATNQPDFDGMEAGVVVAHKEGGALEYRHGALVGSTTEKLVGGWAKVYSSKRSHPSEAVVSVEEYNTHRSLWKTKPATMIRKVALVQAIREAYPGKFGGVYDSAEMPEHESPKETEEPIEIETEEERIQAQELEEF